MAATFKTLRCFARSGSPYTIPRARRKPAIFSGDCRTFTSTHFHRADEQANDEADSSATPLTSDSPQARHFARRNNTTPESAAEFLNFLDQHNQDYDSQGPQRPYDKEGNAIVDPEQELAAEQGPLILPRPPPNNRGFFAMDEENEDPGEDPDFKADDISSTAHGELEQVRELRELFRVAAWDMPLLWKHRKEFKAPVASEQPLRFRYTTYMGETHPGSRKVVLDFSPANLPNLTDAQQRKMIKLLGTRFDPHTSTAKISCDRFPTPAQNKRYLLDMLDKLLAEARDRQDMFEDVPFDFRHARVGEKKRKRRLLQTAFPEEWKLGSVEKVRQLEARRSERERAERSRIVAGELVDGGRAIEAAIGVTGEEREPVMAGASRAGLY